MWSTVDFSLWKSQEIFTRLFKKFYKKGDGQENLEDNGVCQMECSVVWDCLGQRKCQGGVSFEPPILVSGVPSSAVNN